MKKGEPVLMNQHGNYWGRTLSGQAIKLDSVISEICYDLELLKGQLFERDEF